MRLDSTFRDGVIERYWHCGDGLVGLVWLIAGAGHREPWETDYSPTRGYVAGDARGAVRSVWRCDVGCCDS